MVTDRFVGHCVRHAGQSCFPKDCCMNGLKPGELMQPTEYEAPNYDKVYKPSHYAKWQIEPITFIMRNGMEFWRGNIIKYATRAGSKEYEGMDARESEITDLEKVRRYAEMRINQLKGETVL